MEVHKMWQSWPYFLLFFPYLIYSLFVVAFHPLRLDKLSSKTLYWIASAQKMCKRKQILIENDTNSPWRVQSNDNFSRALHEQYFQFFFSSFWKKQRKYLWQEKTQTKFGSPSTSNTKNNSIAHLFATSLSEIIFFCVVVSHGENKSVPFWFSYRTLNYERTKPNKKKN